MIKFRFQQNPVYINILDNSWIIFFNIKGIPITHTAVGANQFELPTTLIGQDLFYIVLPTFITYTTQSNILIGVLQEFIKQSITNISITENTISPVQKEAPIDYSTIATTLLLSNIEPSSTLIIEKGGISLKANEWLPVYTTYIYTLSNIQIYDGTTVHSHDSFNNNIFRFSNIERALCIIPKE